MAIDFVPTVAGVSLVEAPAFLKAPGGVPANVPSADMLLTADELNVELIKRAKWMIEVDLRKKVLLAATVYSKSKKESDGLSHDAETINSARMKSGCDPIPSEMSRYLDGGQACKKRRQ